MKTGSKEMGREDEEVNGRNGKSLPKYCQLSYDGTCRSKLAQLVNTLAVCGFCSALCPEQRG